MVRIFGALLLAVAMTAADDALGDALPIPHEKLRFAAVFAPVVVVLVGGWMQDDARTARGRRLGMAVEVLGLVAALGLTVTAVGSGGGDGFSRGMSVLGAIFAGLWLLRREAALAFGERSP